MASSSGSNKKKELNDGAFRKSWACPETDADWLLYGRTHADRPITEEELDEWEDAWFEYMNRYDGDLDIPPTYMDTNRISELQENPPSTQLMPEKLKKAIQVANEEIDGFGEEWKRRRERQLEKEEDIKNMKEGLKVMTKDLKTLENELKEANQTEDDLQRQINEHADWIQKCKNVYQH